MPRSRLLTLMKWGLSCLMAGTVLAAHAEDPASADAVPDCDYCQARLHTLAALRKQIPQDWQIEQAHEPVFDSTIAVLQAGASEAPPLLLVHGLGQKGMTDWFALIPLLAQQYHVIALDLPGFDYSESPVGKYTPTRYAEVLSWLLKRTARTPAIVVGHSLGGAVALRLAEKHPDQVEKLVLVDAAGILQRTAFVKHTVTGRLNTEGTPDFLRGIFNRVRDVADNTVEKVLGLPDPTTLLNASSLLQARVLGSRSNANAALALTEENFTEAIYTIKTPTQIIWGAEDPVAPLRTGQMLARRMPLAQLQVLPGVGHAPMDPPSLAAFRSELQHALILPPMPEPLTPLRTTIHDIDCNNESGTVLSGQYKEVRLNHCIGVRLQNLQAQHLVIHDSIVQMTNVSIDAPHSDAAIEVSDSELIATASEIRGQNAIRADNARVDLAGVILGVSKLSALVKRSSFFVLSACRVESPLYTGYWQGTQNVADTVLHPQ